MSEEEREYATQRLSGHLVMTEEGKFKYLMSSLARLQLMARSVAQEHEETFSWSEVKRGVFNLQVWFTATAYFGILAGLYSFGLFVS